MICSNLVQSETKTASRLRTFVSSENRAFQWYRFKFSIKGNAGRKSLFSELEDCINKLERLLKVSDNSRQRSQLSSQRSSSSLGRVTEPALSSFWKHADKFFYALTSSWNCRCRGHTANLLLVHRTTNMPEFEVLLAREMKTPPSTVWQTRNTRIVAVEQAVIEPTKKSVGISESPTVHAPAHRSSHTLKSALRKLGGSKGKAAMFKEVE